MFKSVLTPPTCKRSGLEGKLVVDIAAGGKIRDSNDVYLALTDKGEVYSWGAGDFRCCGSVINFCQKKILVEESPANPPFHVDF